MRSLLNQMVKYVLVGMFVYAADFACYAAILWSVPDSYLLSNVVGKAVGAATGFLLHRKLTFAGQHQFGAAQQAISYASLVVLNIALSSVLLWLFVARSGYDELWVKPFVDALVICSTFLAGRCWIYRPA